MPATKPQALQILSSPNRGVTGNILKIKAEHNFKAGQNCFQPLDRAVRAVECKQQEQMHSGFIVFGESSGREEQHLMSQKANGVPRCYYLRVS